MAKSKTKEEIQVLLKNENWVGIRQAIKKRDPYSPEVTEELNAIYEYGSIYARLITNYEAIFEGTLLQAASENKRLDIVKLLLSHNLEYKKAIIGTFLSLINLPSDLWRIFAANLDNFNIAKLARLRKEIYNAGKNAPKSYDIEPFKVNTLPFNIEVHMEQFNFATMMDDTQFKITEEILIYSIRRNQLKKLNSKKYTSTEIGNITSFCQRNNFDKLSVENQKKYLHLLKLMIVATSDKTALLDILMFGLYSFVNPKIFEFILKEINPDKNSFLRLYQHYNELCDKLNIATTKVTIFDKKSIEFQLNISSTRVNIIENYIFKKFGKSASELNIVKKPDRMLTDLAITSYKFARSNCMIS